MVDQITGFEKTGDKIEHNVVVIGGDGSVGSNLLVETASRSKDDIDYECGKFWDIDGDVDVDVSVAAN